MVILYISAKHVLENLRDSASGSHSSVFPEMCNLLYTICHIFVHRCILNSWNFLFIYYLCLFYMNIFIILKRPYLNFLFKNCTVL